MDIEIARRFLLDMEKEASKVAERQFAEAESVFDEITHYIEVHYQPLEIRKCGSLLFKEIFNENSDIDIAVRRISFQGLLELFLHYEDITPHRVHIIDIDSLGLADKNVLIKYSEVVYSAS